MDLVIQAVKSDLWFVIETGRYMLGGFFLLAVVNQYMKMAESKVSWGGLILRLVLGFALLQNYAWVMDTSRGIVSGLDQRINPEQSYVTQYAVMSINMQQKFEDNTQQSLIEKAGNFLFGKFTLHNVIINLSFIFYAILSKVMEAIRYCVIAILYKLGPILIPLILFDSTRRILRGWFTSYISVLCWPILWHIVLGTAVALSGVIGGEIQDIEQFAALNFSVCFVLMFTPVIIAGIVGGIGAGSAAAIAGVVSSRALGQTFGHVNRAGRNFVNKVASVSKESGAGNFARYRSTPTVSKGKFKDEMIGAEK